MKITYIYTVTSLVLGVLVVLGVDCWHCLTGIKGYTVSLAAGAFEGDHVSFDFN